MGSEELYTKKALEWERAVVGLGQGQTEGETAASGTIESSTTSPEVCACGQSPTKRFPILCLSATIVCTCSLILVMINGRDTR